MWSEGKSDESIATSVIKWEGRSKVSGWAEGLQDTWSGEIVNGCQEQTWEGPNQGLQS